MIVKTPNQPGAQAVADVLRVVPVSDAVVPPVTDQGLITFAPTLNGYLLRFSVKANLRYSVQKSVNPGVGWSTLQISSQARDGVLEYIDFKPYPSQAFYRILQQ